LKEKLMQNYFYSFKIDSIFAQKLYFGKSALTQWDANNGVENAQGLTRFGPRRNIPVADGRKHSADVKEGTPAIPF
jgi:hypothetical protein